MQLQLVQIPNNRSGLACQVHCCSQGKGATYCFAGEAQLLPHLLCCLTQPPQVQLFKWHLQTDNTGMAYITLPLQVQAL
jgi:hypothetical protein